MLNPERPIYLDFHATTPVDPRVLQEMLPYFTERFGNPHSRQHAWGWQARDAVETARGQVAALLNASPSEIVFTSGASESNNLAIKGAAAAHQAQGRRIVTAATEHKSVLDACRRLGERGFDVVIVGARRDGVIDLEALARAVTPETVLVSVMAANNEIGTLQPVADIAAIAHRQGALLHTDAAQGAGKVPIDVRAVDIDLLSLTAHKMYGPKGSGALFIRRRQPRIALEPQIDGGGQEAGIRSGTLNVPAIVGLGRAAEICRLEMAEESRRLAALRDALLAGLRESLDGVVVNGTLDRRLPHNLHVSFAGVDTEPLLTALGDIAVSTGSACSSGSQKPSHVLEAIGAVGPEAGASIRFGLGRTTTREDVECAVERVSAIVGSLRRKGSRLTA
ncbi:MAG TPA: aminotransferase class V-fold PLP-dependent enzyme [Vicinamibacterales bacterium]|jgi:cysteine desulfurase